MIQPLNRDFRCLEVLQINAGGSESHLKGIGVGVDGTVRPPLPLFPPPQFGVGMYRVDTETAQGNTAEAARQGRAV